MAEAPWGELQGRGIGPGLVCPGLTDTGLQETARLTDRAASAIKRFQPSRSESVARAIVAAVCRRRREARLTGLGRLMVGLNRVSPALTARLITPIALQELRRSH